MRVEEAKRVTVDDLSLGVLKYKTLGLNFERVADNTLKFSFTHLDPSDSGRKFFFVLNANDDEDLYEIVECEPPLHPRTIFSFVTDLNSSMDISTFVRDMRRGFSDLLAECM